MPKYKKETSSARLKHIVVPSLPRAAAPPPPLVRRLVDRLKAAFAFLQRQKEPSLLGRIHELDSHAEEYQALLGDIKGRFSQEDDSETFLFVEAIIDPLLREIERIQKGLHSGSVMQQAKTFKAYGEWIDRAKVWVQFHEKVHSKQQIIDAVVEQLVGETLKRIDRDLLVIADYRHYQTAALPLTSERRRCFDEELADYLRPHQEQLVNLKRRPAQLSLDEMSRWKKLIDSQRQTFFENALHVIDAFVERESPSSAAFAATEHLHEVVSEIAYVERETSDLLAEIRHLPPDDWRRREMLHSHLVALEEQTHLLHLDMRIGWELVSRLQKISAALDQGRRQLDQKI